MRAFSKMTIGGGPMHADGVDFRPIDSVNARMNQNARLRIN
jgi:hypothetical protein